MIEHKVGDVVEVNGVKYRAVKRNGKCYECKCDILKCAEYIDIFGLCSKYYRPQNNDNIKWEIVK